MQTADRPVSPICETTPRRGNTGDPANFWRAQQKVEHPLRRRALAFRLPQYRPVAVASRTLGRMMAIVALLIGLSAGCAAAPNVVDPGAQPIVDRIRASPSPRVWEFTYRTESHSPYGACLTGIDEVSGVIDLESGAMSVEPNREAPQVIVASSSFMVRRTGAAPSWAEVSWTPSDDPTALRRVFGEVLANFIATGLREPDLAMTALAAIDIATTVELSADPVVDAADTIRITVDSDLYLQELEAVGATIAEDDRAPTLLVSVDELGRVTKIVVDMASAEFDSEGQQDAYTLAATYDNVEAVNLPQAAQRHTTELESIQYPSPGQSCVFGM